MKTLTFLALISALAAASTARADTNRQALQTLFANGNYAEAYQGFRKALLEEDEPESAILGDIRDAITCLTQLGRHEEADEFLESVVEHHPKHWQALSGAANGYQGILVNNGIIVAGRFSRGNSRGGIGRYVMSAERDRVREIQLYLRALALRPPPTDAAEIYSRLASAISRNQNQEWKLQGLSDLSALPDYEDPFYSEPRGAPADAHGDPVYFHLPASWESAANDGERMRWALAQEAAADPSRKDKVTFQLALFWQSLYDVQTLAAYPWIGVDDGTAAGTYAVHTLAEDETIARLATGVKRFHLPDEFNFIGMLRSLKDSNAGYAQNAIESLAALFENRRQYSKAAELWQLSIDRFGESDYRRSHLAQIIGAWGEFAPIPSEQANRPASLEFKFRNAASVQLDAFEIDIPALLSDLKEYLKSNPIQIDYQRLEIENVGYRLVQQHETKYLKAKAASWSEVLSPRPNHFDTRVTLKTPLKRAGAYLVKAKVAGGNESQMVLWVNDTIIVRKAQPDSVRSNGALYFVADAESGKPVTGAKLDLFGWRSVPLDHPALISDALGRSSNIETSELHAETNESGIATASPGPQFQWLATAGSANGRFAFLGFSGGWYGGRGDNRAQQKAFVITDRPVYRPEQTVKFKIWLAQTKYDGEGPSPYAHQRFHVAVNDPRGEKFWEQTLTADDFGGSDAEIPLGKGAALGVYPLIVDDFGYSASFRVEEYKKPEFEVTIDAPKEPVMLGEKIRATLNAKYYFGAPVVNARVKYKVLRSAYDARWFPEMPWDWLFGTGYWWFAYDYEWYPGWGKWGCRGPIRSWWPGQSGPPELVQENEVSIGPGGTAVIEIDSSAAKELHGDTDHRYTISAEVTDESRRSIGAQGEVLVSRDPFRVYAWLDRGHYRTGDSIRAQFSAQTLAKSPIRGEGKLRLLRVTYADGKPSEQAVQEWKLDTGDEGTAELVLKAAAPGQYRLSYSVTDAKHHEIEGGYVFSVYGTGALDSTGAPDSSFRFNDIEIVPDKREYAPGDTMHLAINTNHPDSTVLLFVRAENGVYPEASVIALKGKSAVRDIVLTKADMPNIFVEALTVSGGQVFTGVRQIAVPPENRVYDVHVEPSAEKYKPGDEAAVSVRVTDPAGHPVAGALVLSVYDKAVEYISGGSNVPSIKEFFWKWQRHHAAAQLTNADVYSVNLVPAGADQMSPIGVLGASVSDESDGSALQEEVGERLKEKSFGGVRAARMAGSPLSRLQKEEGLEMDLMSDAGSPQPMRESKTDAGPALPASPGQTEAAAAVRKQFADTAFWAPSLTTDSDGRAKVTFKMPENLTTWKIRAWSLGSGARVGDGDATVVTTKNLLLRLQAPRFFVEKDEVTLSANIHNYLRTKKHVRARIELPGSVLELLDSAEKEADIEPQSEARVDWHVKAKLEGDAIVRMSALTDEESDATEMAFPVHVHGMLKTESFSGYVAPTGSEASLEITVPAERRPEQTRLEIRYSPTLAAAMLDALPYLASYPYDCTEQTLNRFLPSVISQSVLKSLGVNLREIKEKRTNLNAQEIGGDQERAKQWKRFDENPVFDEDQLAAMVKFGVQRLEAMQLSDGGWGWFSGTGEESTAHMTASVVHGLQIARRNGVQLREDTISRGISWLQNYQAAELQKLKNAPSRTQPYKNRADELDAFVTMVLSDAEMKNPEMREMLYRDRMGLAVYAKTMFALALSNEKQTDQLAMLMRNIAQYLVQDEENQTAYLRLPEDNYWWSWFGSEYEAQAYYLKLLARAEPKSTVAPRLVKYLLNNRKNATYWSSTRDTAIVVEAFADFLKASGEAAPDAQLEILIDGKIRKQVTIRKENLFTFDNKLVLEGDALSGGHHKIEIRKRGKSPIYFNAYLTNFTLEDPIARAGLEVKLNRAFYKLDRADTAVLAAGDRGQAIAQRVEKYKRTKIESLAELKSGDLAEVELEIDSKNDYEYMLFEDMKAAGFEPAEVRSGYNGNDLGAYVEFRDDRVAFFARALPRGKHSVSYRLRAEVPGKFSALPARASAMYAPELKANSDEFKIGVTD